MRSKAIECLKRFLHPGQYSNVICTASDREYLDEPVLGEIHPQDKDLLKSQ